MNTPSLPEPLAGPVAPEALRGRLGTEGAPALVDVRDDGAFASGHLPGSGHVPIDRLAERRTELPPRERAVVVIAGTAGDARRGAEALETLGYLRVSWLDAPIEAMGDRALDRSPASRLWRPAEFLTRIVAGIPRGRAADLAAGSGRDATFLATQGFDVEAWDESPEALAMAEALAARSGVRVTTRRANLESPAFRLEPGRYALVTCFRFLHRPLFPVMVESLAPGGHLVYETYRLGQERFGRPRRAKFLLRRGELRAAFESLGVEVLDHEEPDPEEGPIMSRLWGRRKS